MPLNTFPNDELRTHCKRIVENLELWLRRFINEKLTASYGADYLNKKKSNGEFVLKTEVRRNLETKRSSNPNRYPRTIDAATLEEEIYLVCHPEFYDIHFKKGLEEAFPASREGCREFLGRLIEPRNKLYHANPISVRDAERIICYSNDVIASLKSHYTEIGMASEFNAPVVIKISDSFGATFHADQIHRNAGRKGQISRQKDAGINLRPGDSLSLEVDVDPTFEPETYRITWQIGGEQQEGRRATIVIRNEHVSENFVVWCHVVSNKDWHRLGNEDDCVTISYVVYPPING